MLRALEQHGFPVGIQGTALVMKRPLLVQDAIFKQQVTTYLRQFVTVIATLDIEPANANVFRRAFPQSTFIHYSAPTMPNPPPLLPEIVRLDSFASPITVAPGAPS